MNTIVKTKYCSTCREEKDVNCFTQNRRSCDGLCRQCKGCIREALVWRSQNGYCKGCSSPRLSNSNTYCEKHYFMKTSKNNLGDSKHWQALRDKFYAQGCRCPYTGNTLVLGVNAGLDHIKSQSRRPDLAKEISNVEWVDREVNNMKRAMNKDEFVAKMEKMLKNVALNELVSAYRETCEDR